MDGRQTEALLNAAAEPPPAVISSNDPIAPDVGLSAARALHVTYTLGFYVFARFSRPVTSSGATVFIRHLLRTSSIQRSGTHDWAISGELTMDMTISKRYRLLDIIHGLTAARAHAGVMAEESPEHAERLNKFSSDLSSLQAAFLDQLKRDGLYARPPFEVD